MPESTRGHLGTADDVILPRVGAFVVDHVLSGAVAVVAGVALAIALRSEAGIWLGVPAGVFGYFIVLEWAFGRTLGKRLFGVVVVSRDGSPITMRQSAARNLLRIVDGLFSYAVGLVVMLLNEDCQRIGDLFADTVVVRARRRTR